MIVYINNLNQQQTDKGLFNGTVFFSVSDENKVESDFGN